MLWKWRSTAFIKNATGDGSKLGNPLLIYKKLTEINSNLIRKLAIGWWISRWMDAGCWTFRHQHRSTVQLWKIYMKRPSWCSLLLIVSITTVHFSRWRPYEIFMNRAGFQRPNCGSEFRINPPPLLPPLFGPSNWFDCFHPSHFVCSWIELPVESSARLNVFIVQPIIVEMTPKCPSLNLLMDGCWFENFFFFFNGNRDIIDVIQSDKRASTLALTFQRLRTLTQRWWRLISLNIGRADWKNSATMKTA